MNIRSNLQAKVEFAKRTITKDTKSQLTHLDKIECLQIARFKFSKKKKIPAISKKITFKAKSPKTKKKSSPERCSISETIHFPTTPNSPIHKTQEEKEQAIVPILELEQLSKIKKDLKKKNAVKREFRKRNKRSSSVKPKKGETLLKKMSNSSSKSNISVHSRLSNASNKSYHTPPTSKISTNPISAFSSKLNSNFANQTNRKNQKEKRSSLSNEIKATLSKRSSVSPHQSSTSNTPKEKGRNSFLKAKSGNQNLPNSQEKLLKAPSPQKLNKSAIIMKEKSQTESTTPRQKTTFKKAVKLIKEKQIIKEPNSPKNPLSPNMQIKNHIKPIKIHSEMQKSTLTIKHPKLKLKSSQNIQAHTNPSSPPAFSSAFPIHTHLPPAQAQPQTQAIPTATPHTPHTPHLHTQTPTNAENSKLPSTQPSFPTLSKDQTLKQHTFKPPPPHTDPKHPPHSKDSKNNTPHNRTNTITQTKETKETNGFYLPLTQKNLQTRFHSDNIKNKHHNILNDFDFYNMRDHYANFKSHIRNVFMGKHTNPMRKVYSGKSDYYQRKLLISNLMAKRRNQINIIRGRRTIKAGLLQNIASTVIPQFRNPLSFNPAHTFHSALSERVEKNISPNATLNVNSVGLSTFENESFNLAGSVRQIDEIRETQLLDQKRLYVDDISLEGTLLVDHYEEVYLQGQKTQFVLSRRLQNPEFPLPSCWCDSPDCYLCDKWTVVKIKINLNDFCFNESVDEWSPDVMKRKAQLDSLEESYENISPLLSPHKLNPTTNLRTGTSIFFSTGNRVLEDDDESQEEKSVKSESEEEEKIIRPTIKKIEDLSEIETLKKMNLFHPLFSPTFRNIDTLNHLINPNLYSQLSYYPNISDQSGLTIRETEIRELPQAEIKEETPPNQEEETVERVMDKYKVKLPLLKIKEKKSGTPKFGVPSNQVISKTSKYIKKA